MHQHLTRLNENVISWIQKGNNLCEDEDIRKKMSLVFRWEEPDERGRMCIVKGKEEQFWDISHQDLQLYHYAQLV
jgi:hypothetical protein